MVTLNSLSRTGTLNLLFKNVRATAQRLSAQERLRAEKVAGGKTKSLGLGRAIPLASLAIAIGASPILQRVVVRVMSSVYSSQSSRTASNCGKQALENYG